MSARPAPVQTHLVEVRLRREHADPEASRALELLREQGLASLKEARLARLYRLVGELTAHHAQQAARDILCDPVTQEWRMVAAAAPSANGMNAWRVEVWLRSSVTDPVGETVRAAFPDAGLPRPQAVRSGLAYLLAGRAAKPQLEKAVLRCLANPLIHRVAVHEAHP